MKFLKKPVPLWSHFAVLGIVLLVVGALVGGFAAGILTPPWVATALSSQSVIKNEQVVTSMEKKEQSVLLELKVKSVSEARGVPPTVIQGLPFLEKARYMIYTSKVKLGVDAVTVVPTGDHEFVVQVPPFIWIGEDDTNIEQVISDDGILSAFTTQQSEVDQFNAIFTDELKDDYLEQNDQTLRDQTEFYFTKLATSIDPDAKLTFEFTGGGFTEGQE